MDMEWKQELIRQAEVLDMYEPFLNGLRKCKTKQDALRLYKAGIAWAVDVNYPSIDFLRDNFTNRELRSFGVYIDHEFHGEVINDHIYQVFHNCTGIIKVKLNEEKLIIPTLYITSNSNLHVVVDYPSGIIIYLGDTGQASAEGIYTFRHIPKENKPTEVYYTNSL